MSVRVRIAPSPTGYLHVGTARTALFNFLFARANGGKFLLRVEDTDAKRSTQEATDAILSSLDWLGLNPDEAPIYQSKNIDRHKQVAEELLASGNAYKCFVSAEELAAKRAEAEANKQNFKFQSPWRDASSETHPDGEYVVRFKSPQTGTSTINDKVQGKVSVENETLDDLVILRADGTPTYMLAVVADDNDMQISHIIRGDDHLTNSFKQKAIYEALGWKVPDFCHIPLIHGPDGAKLSKRHGALGVGEYEKMGYLPEGMCNYLLRLGWSHGDDEIIGRDQAIEWFNLENIGKSPSRIDFDKMADVNGHYLRQYSNDKLLVLLKNHLPEDAPANALQTLQKLMDALKERSNTIIELAENSAFIFARVPYTEKAQNMLNSGGNEAIADLLPQLENLADWQGQNIKQIAFDYGQSKGLKLGKILPALRSGVCGTMEAPDLMLVLESLGKEECIKRLKNL